MSSEQTGRMGAVEKREGHRGGSGRPPGWAGTVMTPTACFRPLPLAERILHHGHKSIPLGHITCTLLIALIWLSYVSDGLSPTSKKYTASDLARIQVWETTWHEISVNVTTMIKYLISGRSATTNTSVTRPEPLGSTLLLAVFVTLVSWPVTTTLSVALRSAGGSWPGRAGWLFVGCRDNFSWEV